MAKDTSAGEMNWRIELQMSTSEKDAYGQPVTTWETIACVWAKKENPMSGNTEKVFGDIESAVTRAVWTIWWRPGITEGHRIKDGSTYYDIMNIHEVGYRDKLMLITEKRTA